MKLKKYTRANLPKNFKQWLEDNLNLSSDCSCYICSGKSNNDGWPIREWVYGLKNLPDKIKAELLPYMMGEDE